MRHLILFLFVFFRSKVTSKLTAEALHIEEVQRLRSQALLLHPYLNKYQPTVPSYASRLPGRPAEIERRVRFNRSFRICFHLSAEQI